MTRQEMDLLGWKELDILLVSGDADVDHPSFGVALLGRWLSGHGFKVGVVAQPKWDCRDEIAAMGRPRLFAGVSAGALDSMLAHYTAFRNTPRPWRGSSRAAMFHAAVDPSGKPIFVARADAERLRQHRVLAL